MLHSFINLSTKMCFTYINLQCFIREDNLAISTKTYTYHCNPYHMRSLNILLMCLYSNIFVCYECLFTCCQTMPICNILSYSNLFFLVIICIPV